MKTEILIAGAGGCGREVYTMALETFSTGAYHIKGFLTDQAGDLDAFPDIRERAPVVGTIAGYEPQADERILLAIGSPAGRRKVAEILKARGAAFLSLLHPSARIDKNARIGEGCIIYPFALVGIYSTLEDFAMVNAYAGVAHDAVVGRYSVLAPYAVALGGSRVGEACFMAAHATLAPKKELGERAVISAGSVALRSAPADAFVCGVPGKNF